MVKRYVDGFVLLVPKKNFKDYEKMASLAGKIWIKHGALQYAETRGDDLESVKEFGAVPFTKLTKAKEDEEVIFSFITYKSKAHRNKVNKLVMADPKMIGICGDGKNMPFEMKKMSMGGFETFVCQENFK